MKIGSGSYLAKRYTYDSAGRVSTVADYYNFRAGDSTSCILLTYTYDAFGRVIDMKYTKGGETIEEHSYEYDKNSNIVKEHNVNTASGLDEIREFAYDDLSQLKHSVIKNRTTTTTEVEGEADAEGNPTTTIKTEVREQVAKETDYTYDSVGNRTKKVENGTATSYTYNGLNQLLTEKDSNVNLTYSYDANGNQTGITGTAGGSSVNKAFTYTPDNMLATYTEGSKTEENVYTGDGQRIQKKEGSDVTNYFYQFGSVLYTTDANDSLKSFNLLNVSDAFGTARKSGTGESYYLYTEDLRGSTVNVLDNSVSQVVSYWYDDFGDVTESKASSYDSFDNELQYTGAVYDASTGLLYLNARFYDPQTGRFISRDTYRGERNDAGTWHLYLYCANNPVNYVDPSGHYAQAIYYSANVYRVVASAAKVGAFVSGPGGVVLVITVLLGVTIYGGVKYYKAKTKKANETKKSKKKGARKKKQTKKSNKEKANDVPTWVKNYKQKVNENGTRFADRVCNDRYGKNNYRKGPGTEYNKIRKWGDRRIK